MRKLNKDELENLKNLIKDKELKGANYIRSYILLNTYEPKYKIGDYIKFSCYREYIYGNEIINFKGKIDKINYCFSPMFKGEEHIQYEIICKDQNGQEFTNYCEEYIDNRKSQRFVIEKTNSDLNEIAKKSKYSQSTNI